MGEIRTVSKTLKNWAGCLFDIINTLAWTQNTRHLHSTRTCTNIIQITKYRFKKPRKIVKLWPANYDVQIQESVTSRTILKHPKVARHNTGNCFCIRLWYTRPHFHRCLDKTSFVRVNNADWIFTYCDDHFVCMWTCVELWWRLSEFHVCILGEGIFSWVVERGRKGSCQFMVFCWWIDGWVKVDQDLTFYHVLWGWCEITTNMKVTCCFFKVTSVNTVVGAGKMQTKALIGVRFSISAFRTFKIPIEWIKHVVTYHNHITSHNIITRTKEDM